MEKKKEIGKRIKLRREQLGMSQEKLGSLLWLNKSTIQRYESGKITNIKIPILHAIAKQLNVDPNWLVLKTDEMGSFQKRFDLYNDDDLTDDIELQEYLEELKNRSEMRMLFSLAKGATKEDVMRAVKIIEALKKDE